MSNERIKRDKYLEDFNFVYKPKKISGLFHRKSPSNTTSKTSDKLQEKLSPWPKPTFESMKMFDLEALPPPVLPPSAFFSSKLSQKRPKQNTPSKLSVAIKKEPGYDAEYMKKFLSPKQSVKRINSQESVKQSSKVSGRHLDQVLFKQKMPVTKPSFPLEFDNTIEMLADSCRKKAAEKEKAYVKASLEIEELKKQLREEQSKLEMYKNKQELTKELAEIGLIRSNYIKTKLDKLIERMDTFKCIFTSLEDMLKQIERAKEAQKDGDNSLREACLLNIKRDNQRIANIRDCKQRLVQLRQYDQWDNLQDLKHSQAIVQQDIIELTHSLSEHQQKIDTLRMSLEAQQYSLQGLTTEMKRFLQDLSVHVSSANNKGVLIQHIKSTMETHQESLKNLLGHIDDLQVMAIDCFSSYDTNAIQEDAELIQKLQDYNEKAAEDLLEERNRHQIEKEEWLKEQKRLVTQISVLNYKEQLRQRERQELQHTEPNVQETNEINASFTNLSNRENVDPNPPKRANLSKGPRKKPDYNRAAARRCSRALKVNTKYIEEAEEEEVDELASQEQSPAKKRRRVRKLLGAAESTGELYDSEQELEKKIQQTISVAIPEEAKNTHLWNNKE
ncbi:hypothetical protein RMCBS344292_01218 [Rhizopus microsporus]|nr:hypothetical protein RMCBS344292_01218 [Rhizopus microsporus]